MSDASTPRANGSATSSGAAPAGHATRSPQRFVRVAVLVGLSFGLALLGSPQVMRPVDRYQVGEFASQTIRAPYDFSVVDEEATQQQRAAAAARSPVVARLDTRVPGALRSGFSQSWHPVRQVLASAEGSATNARERRSTRAGQRDPALADALDAAFLEVGERLGVGIPEPVRQATGERAGLEALVDGFGQLIAEAYRTPVVGDGSAIRRLRPEWVAEAEPLRVRLVDTVSGGEVPFDDQAQLRDLSAARQQVAEQAPRVLAGFHPATVEWVAGIAGSWLRPNVQPDEAATVARRTAAQAAVLPVSLNFKRNQLIVGEGQPVTRQARLVLESLRAQRFGGGTWWRVLGRAGVMCSLALLAFWTEDRGRTRFAIDARAFSYAVTSLVATAVLFRLWLEVASSIIAQYPWLPEPVLVVLFPAAASAMYARIVLPLQPATTYIVVQSVFLGLLWQADLLFFVYWLVSGSIGGLLAARCDRRQCVVRAGLLTGVAAAPVAACLALLGVNRTADALAWVAAAAIVSCALSGLTMLAVGPLFEWMFGHMTRIRLVELMNYQHPLLRKLTEATPGTFQHSVTVGLLADAAARVIGADALLARVGALYHDVGKTKHPEFFAENQHGVNPHDALPPLDSARIVIGHVEEGERMVEQAGLGGQITDVVREHHGTTSVRYFLSKAERRGDPVNPDDFRYPGPRPRSRETGILMIADQVEATARAMDDPDEASLRTMVDRTIERIQGERQLDECPLTLEELSAIREAFVQVLVGVHHRRIKYPGIGPGASPAAAT